MVLDHLFKRTIAPFARGIGIVSNTSRENEQDVEGDLQEELTYRVKPKTSTELGVNIRKLSTEEFYKFFKLRAQSKQGSQDFYRMREVLPFEVLAFPLTQGLVKKALILFESPLESIQLQKIMRIILGELRRPIGKHPHSKLKESPETAPPQDN